MRAMSIETLGTVLIVVGVMLGVGLIFKIAIQALPFGSLPRKDTTSRHSS
jgi:hypothetical protein